MPGPIAALVRACTFVGLSAFAACGDKTAPAPTSASAPPEPPACEKVPRAEQDKRCEAGEAHCCTLVLDATPANDPKYFDAIARACGTGHEPACQIVRDANREPSWKLETLSRACTRMGRWPCRTAAQLAIVIAPADAPKAIDAYCKQTGDAELVVGGQALKCSGLDATKLNQLRPDADACKAGDLAACKSLAGVDGAAVDLLSQLAWSARGVAPSTAVDNRVERDYLGSVVDIASPLVGSVAFGVEDAGSLDKDALVKALGAERKDVVGRCLTWALDHHKKTRGDLLLEAAVDKSGRIAYAVEAKGALAAKTTLKTETDLVQCVRHRLQDARLTDPRADVVNVVLKLTFSP
jgi:hypothetical protein